MQNCRNGGQSVLKVEAFSGPPPPNHVVDCPPVPVPCHIATYLYSRVLRTATAEEVHTKEVTNIYAKAVQCHVCN